jgi:hypothetical protein
VCSKSRLIGIRGIGEVTGVSFVGGFGEGPLLLGLAGLFAVEARSPTTRFSGAKYFFETRKTSLIVTARNLSVHAVLDCHDWSMSQNPS